MNRKQTIELVAPAKINLNLHISGRRPDGYHLIDSVVQTIGLHDTVFLRAAFTDSAGSAANIFAAEPRRFKGKEGEPFESFEGRIVVDYSEEAPPGSDTGDPSRNLLVRALDLSLRQTGPHVFDRLLTGSESASKDQPLYIQLHLKKRIPSGAGMGGGSSDAAAIIKLLKTLAGDSSDFYAERTALELGADIPFLLRGGTARMEGIGEQLTQLEGDLPVWHYLLIKPDYAIATKDAYAAVDRSDYMNERFDQERFIRAMYASHAEGMQFYGGNDFLPVISETADLSMWKRKLLETGPLLADLSGSGSTLFAAYETQKGAESARLALKEAAAAEKVRLILTSGRPKAYNLSIM